ncbi:MAG: alpha/beta hydrolase [Rhodospirillaceae bacterium]|nr:alpha/beta hydrolase [Rhodospirillaceae bacterium]
MVLARRTALGGAALLAAAATGALAQPTPEVVIERRFARCRYGQLHLYAGQPKVSPRVKRTPVLCLHQTPASGRTFLNLIGELAADRLVMAADTPGYGDSARPPYPATISAYADAMADAMGDLGYGRAGKQIDVLAYHTGCLIGADLAVRYPRLVRRLVLTAIPYYPDPEKRKQSLERIERWSFSDDPKPVLDLWQSTVQKRAAGVSLEQSVDQFMERLRPGDKEWWGYEAVFNYDPAVVLPKITQKTLILNPHGALLNQTLAAAGAMPGATLIDLPELSHAVFQLGPKVIAAHSRTFLDA